MAMTIDGLVSGLDTTNLVRQLMQLERQPVVRLQARKTAIDARVTAYQDLSTRFAAIRDAAKALATSSGWQATRATSTAPGVLGASSTPSAPSGTLTVRVEQLAAAHSLASTGTVGSLGEQVVGPGTTLTLQSGGDPVLVDLGDGTLGAAIEAINASGGPVRATAVKVAADQYRLVLTSTTSGTAGAIAIDPPGAFDATLGGLAEVTAAADARLVVGDGPGAFTITSSTNTFADVMPGVTLTAHSASTDPITVSVATDHDAVADRVAALIDALNSALSHITTKSAYDAETRKAGIFTGDSMVRRLQQSLVSTVTAGGSLADLGIELTRDGTVTFDRDRFAAAHQADPAAVAERFTATGGATDGFARRLDALAATASGGGGLLPLAIDGRKSAARQLERQIDSWDSRLALRERALRSQFSALETALGQLQNQSSWLAGQIAGLQANNAAR